MADEADGIDEALAGMLRIGLTAAGRLAEVAARSREQAARQARQVSEAQARDLAARLQAERAAARAQLAPVDRSDWWNSASVDDIALMWETAAGWRGRDPVADRAADRIREEVRSRYGVDVDSPGADPAAVRAVLERSGAAAELSAGSRPPGARQDEADAAALLAAADRADREREPDQDGRHADPAQDRYDTPGRRRELAAELATVADSEAVSARTTADTFQALPATDAVDHPPRTASAVRGPAATISRMRQRSSELGR